MSNPGFTRRSALVAAASFGAGATLDHLITPSAGRPSQGEVDQDRVSFFGPNQAGIDTPAQEFLAFAAYDLTAESLDSLRSLLMSWTAVAAVLTEGKTYEGRGGSKLAPPIDTGEAVGLPPSALTLTFGFGSSLFLGERGRRLGLATKRPPA